MARKSTSSSSASKKPAARTAAKKSASVATEVRNTAIPKVSAAKKVVTYEMIAKRAFEISMGPTCGTEVDNWLRAERELKGL